MTQYVIATDLNRCVGCLACSVSCKVINGVQPGDFWLKVLRIGPNPKDGGSGQWPDVEHYYLPIQCQHCTDPACVQVCPTEASRKLADGTVQVDKGKCIGCQFCAMACPYGVRYLNEEERVVEKCTLCTQKTAQGGLPQCVAQCNGRARFFGDIEKGLENLEGPRDPKHTGGTVDYDGVQAARCKMGDYVQPFTERDVYRLPDVGNAPSFVYILRDRQWQGEGR